MHSVIMTRCCRCGTMVTQAASRFTRTFYCHRETFLVSVTTTSRQASSRVLTWRLREAVFKRSHHCRLHPRHFWTRSNTWLANLEHLAVQWSLAASTTKVLAQLVHQLPLQYRKSTYVIQILWQMWQRTSLMELALPRTHQMVRLAQLRTTWASFSTGCITAKIQKASTRSRPSLLTLCSISCWAWNKSTASQTTRRRTSWTKNSA